MAKYNWGIGDAIRWHLQIGSAHGLRRLGYATRFYGRIWWLIVFVIALAAFVFGMIKLIAEYSSYPVKLVEKYESMESMDFPRVTICNLNPVNATELSSDNVLSLHNALKNSSIAPGKASVVSHAMKAAANLLDKPNNDDLSFYLPLCTYNGKVCDPSIYFKWVDVAGYGKCAEFTANKPTTTTGTGLRVWVNAPLRDDVGSIRGVEGFRVVVHHKNVEAMPDLTGIDVPTGKSAYLVMSQTRYTRLGAPFSLCDTGAVTSLSCTSDNCVPPCDEVDYKITFSLDSWPSPEHIDSVMNLLVNTYPNYTFNINDLSSIRIHYGELIVYTLAEDAAIGFTSLLSQVGGLSGLCIGFSWITLIEILAICFAGCKDVEKMEKVKVDDQETDRTDAKMPDQPIVDETLTYRE